MASSPAFSSPPLPPTTHYGEDLARSYCPCNCLLLPLPHSRRRHGHPRTRPRLGPATSTTARTLRLPSHRHHTRPAYLPQKSLLSPPELEILPRRNPNGRELLVSDAVSSSWEGGCSGAWLRTLQASSGRSAACGSGSPKTDLNFRHLEYRKCNNEYYI